MRGEKKQDVDKIMSFPGIYSSKGTSKIVRRIKFIL